MKTYYWRIDEIREGGLVEEGSIWSFTTESSGACVPASMTASVVLDTVRGDKGQEYGRATVTIMDNCGNLISDAQVDGHFTGDFASDLVSQTANEAGVAVFVTTTQRKKPSFDFVVDNVAGAGLVY